MSGRPRGSGQRAGIPLCPRHPTSHVVRHGTYGKPGARRQLYLCQPNAGAPHSFSGALARRMLEHGAECDACESHLEPHQGPPTPRRFDFTVREAAEALVSVANGVSYTLAAEAAWASSGRQMGEDDRRPQLAANWVETLTPIATAPLAETTWPETIVCDTTSFQYTDQDTERNRQAFAVMAVWGYEAGDTRGRLWKVHASHRAKEADWRRVFDLLPGAPDLVVCDGAGAISRAVAAKWPQVSNRANWSPAGAEPFVFRCEYHLRRNALGALAGYELHNNEQLLGLLDKAFVSPQGWAAFRRAVAEHISVDAWCDGVDVQVRSQSSWRARLPQVHSNGAVEAAIVAVREAIGTRHAVLRNKYRTNQMLELVRAAINRRANVADLARTLRTDLGGGAMTLHQLSCVDHGTRTWKAGGTEIIKAAKVGSLRR